MSKTVNQNYGISFPALLTIVFIILKLTHVIDWSWWWVLAPIWIGFAVGISIFLIYGLMLIVGLIFINSKKRR